MHVQTETRPSDVAAVIFFISYGRYLDKQFSPGVLIDLFAIDETFPVIAEDSNDDE